MKKLIPLLLGLLTLASIVYAEPTYTGQWNGLMVGSKNEYDASGISISEGELGITYPSFNPQVVYLDIATASNTAYKNTSISTATLVAAVTTFTLANSDYTDIITPRNIVIISSCNAGGTFTGSALVTGKNARGESATETITVSTIAANSTGNIAWSTITSIALTTTATTATAVKIQVGSGVKIGLPSNLYASSEVLKVIEAGSLSTTYTLSTTYDTIEFAAAPDGSKDYTVWLKPKKR